MASWVALADGVTLTVVPGLGRAGVLIPSTLFCGLITVIACCISDFLQAITERDHIAGGRFGGSAFENHTWSRAFAINVKVGIVVDLKCGSV